MSQTPPIARADVLIAGAGIVGLTLAWRLQEAGLSTLVLEAGRAGGGTSSATFAWINATSKTGEEAYHRLNAAGVAAWHALAAEEGAAAIGLCGQGSLQWSQRSKAVVHAQLLADRRALFAFDYPAEWLDRRAMRATLPLLEDLPEDAEGLWAPRDRWLEVATYIAWARQRFVAAGGRLIEETALLERAEKDRWLTARGPVEARRLVVAAGTATNALLQRLGFAARFPLSAVPGFLVETPPTPLGRRLDAVLWSPDPTEIHLRPTLAGGLLLGADDLDAAVGEGSDGDSVQQAKQELLRRAEAWFPRLPRRALATELGWRIGHRPMPDDGRSLVGSLAELPGIFVAVTHSGVTLAPEIGRLLCEWLVSGEQPPALAPFSPARFGL
jgi:glycine/D-amino acid oxidase-like deaminating enzyme